MTEGDLKKKILVFALPLIVSNVLQVLFNMSDIAVVGRFAGAEALGAVGSTAILVSLFTSCLIGISSGMNVLIARYIGAEKENDVKETVHTCFALSIIIGLVMLASGEIFVSGILKLLHTKSELIAGAELYLRIYFIGLPALSLYNFGNASYSAAGNTKTPLYFLFASGVLNVILNLIFVIGLKMSVAGVALATVISEWCAAILLLTAQMIRKDPIKLQLSKTRLYPKKSSLVLALGIPSGLQNVVFAVANLFIQAGVNSFDAVMVEGNSAAANADGLVYDVMNAFYTACASFIGQNFGAGKKDRVKKTYFISLAYSFGAGLIMGIILFIFGRQFLSIFTTEPEVIDAGMHRLSVMALSYGFSAFMDCTIVASRGLGKSVVPMYIVIMGSCVFRLIWIYTIFAYFHTIESLYLLYVFSWSITAVAEIIYFAKIYKSQMASIS